MTFESNGQQISTSLEANGNEQIITCQWKNASESPRKRTETFTWVNGEGWQDDKAGTWSPVLENLFNLK